MKKLFAAIICVFISTALLSLPSLASTLKTSPDIQTISIAGEMEIFEDQTNSLKLENILAPSYQNQFIKNTNPYLKLSYSKSNIWLKFTVSAHQLDNNHYTIVFEDWGLSMVKCYIPEGKGRYITKTAGIESPYEKRQVKGRNLAFELDKLPSTATYYFCVYAPLSSLNLPITLKTQAKHTTDVINDSLFVGLLIGVLLLLSIISLGVFFGTHDNAYIYFSGNVLIMTIWISDTIGLINVLAGNEIQLAFHHNVAWLLALSGIFSTLFAMSFLDTKTNSRTCHNVYKIVLGLITIMPFLLIFASFEVAMHVLSSFAVLLNLLNLSIALYLLIKIKLYHAYVYLTSQVILFIGVILLVLCMFGVVRNNFFTYYSYYISVALQFLTIAYGLVSNINKSKQELEIIVENRTIELSQTLENLKHTQTNLIESKAALNNLLNKVYSLLDNSGEGFLTFGHDLVIDPEYSKECSAIFHKEIKNDNIVALLAGGDKTQLESYNVTLNMVFNTKDSFRRNVLLTLLPKSIEVNEKVIRLKFKYLDNSKIMLVLSDVTYERELEEKIHEEQSRLKFIVESIVSRSDFLDVINSCTRFQKLMLPKFINSNMSAEKIYAQTFRFVHTLKGTSSQLSFVHLPQKLHDLETQIVASQKLLQQNPKLFIDIFNNSCIMDALEMDLDIIDKTLGKDFINDKNKILLDAEQRATLEKLAQLLANYSTSDDPELVKAYNMIKSMKFTSIKTLLGIYPKYTLKQAEKLGKMLLPFEIEGDDFKVDPDKYSGFIKTLIHVFRNAIDHGIETPDERYEEGKAEFGRITTITKKHQNFIEISIHDDGHGINLEKVKNKALELNLITLHTASNMTNQEILSLLFLDEFTTKKNATTMSGRGYGLSAVKNELDKLSGSVEVESSLGIGTKFVFQLPII